MAQTGYTPILIYSSSTAAAAPAAGSLTNSTLGSELAINITDGKLFYKDNTNAVQVIGWKVVPTTAGGTGLTSYAQGDLLYYNSGTTLTALAKNTTATRYLSNTGTNNNPAWAQVDLTNGVTGTLPVGNGGTGLASYTANRILYASGTTTIATSAGLTFDGTNFATTGSATAASFIPTGSSVPSNGVYLPSANVVGFATNTTKRAIFNTDGSFYHYGPEAAFYKDATAGTVSRLDIIPTSTKTQLRTFESGAPSILEITSSKVTLVSCNLAVSNGNGIDFSATPGTGTSELFDDYETGTWTPSFAGSGSNPTVTYSYQRGTYVKVGRQVTISCAINYTATTGGSGNLRISGLPFTSQTGQTERFSGMAGYNDSVAKNLAFLIVDNSAVIDFYDATTTGTTATITVSQLVNGTKFLQFSMTYFANGL